MDPAPSVSVAADGDGAAVGAAGTADGVDEPTDPAAEGANDGAIEANWPDERVGATGSDAAHATSIGASTRRVAALRPMS